MNDNQQPTKPTHIDYAERIRNERLLAEYIKTSLWDEEMNRRREYWLWERSGIHPKKPQHYYR